MIFDKWTFDISSKCQKESTNGQGRNVSWQDVACTVHLESWIQVD